MYKKILLPLDGSKLAEASVGYAVWLAAKSGAELQLMHVYRGGSTSKSPYLERVIASILRRELVAGAQVPIKAVVSRGDPASEILRYTEDNGIDLIAMSTHGHTGLKRWVIGSVADKVIRNSNRPVRLLKSHTGSASGETGYGNRVLALIDGSDYSEQVIPHAAYHARLGGGELILMSVCEPPELVPSASYHIIPHDYPPTRPVQWEKYVEQETAQRKQACGLYLSKLAERNRENGIRTQVNSPFGKPEDEIIKYLEENPVSFIAMTTRGRSGVSRWIFGSVAEKVLLASSQPVLLINPG